MSPRALPVLTSLLAALAVALAARLPGAELAFAQGFALLWLVRLGVGSDGRGLVPRRIGALLIALLLTCAVPYLLAPALGQSPQEPFQRLLGVLTCFLGVLLLLPLSPFGSFWVVLIATLSVAVTCALDGGMLGAVLVPAYVALLTCTLLVLERTLAAGGLHRERSAGHVVLLDAASPLGPALRRGALRLLLGGLTLGLALWMLAPRPGPEAPAAQRRSAASNAGGPSDGRSESGHGSTTGPDGSTSDALLGAVEHIQQDKRVHWEVRLLEGEREPPLLLREAVRDLWLDPRGGAPPRWRSSREAERRDLAPAESGWVELADALSGLPVRRLEARARLGVGLLFLEPEPLAFVVQRPSGAEGEGPLVALHDVTQSVGSGRLRRVVLAGDVVQMRSQPQRRDGPELRGLESHARVAPLTAYAAIDASLAERLRALTADVPGLTASDAWGKARALERWLRGPGFVYELASPELAPGRRVLDFLTRVKRGNCEWYATALTLALRAHGMAARYVQGYWGGSHTPDSNLWTFYGAHYHAWTELYLDGAGWVPLNPTPPERLAEGADPRTGESPRGAWAEAPPPDANVGLPGERLRGLLGDAARRAADGLAWLFSAAGVYLGWLLVVLLGLLGGRRFLRRGQASSARPGRTGAALTPYLEALRLLERRGLGRARNATAREHLARARAALPPDAARAFERLADGHERERYAREIVGGAELEDALERLLRALARAPVAPPA